MSQLCPVWCRADHNEIHHDDQRHETTIRTVPAVIRQNGGPEAGELHIAAFRSFTDEEVWIAVDRLQLTPESARRMMRAVRDVLEDLEGPMEETP